MYIYIYIVIYIWYTVLYCMYTCTPSKKCGETSPPGQKARLPAAGSSPSSVRPRHPANVFGGSALAARWSNLTIGTIFTQQCSIYRTMEFLDDHFYSWQTISKRNRAATEVLPSKSHSFSLWILQPILAPSTVFHRSSLTRRRSFTGSEPQSSLSGRHVFMEKMRIKPLDSLDSLDLKTCPVDHKMP